MKAFLISFLLLAATPALALNQPTFLEQIHNCVELTVAYTRFAQMADDSQPSDRPAFIAYVQQIAEANSSQKARDTIVHMGELAWASRGQQVHAGSMKMYEECYNKLGSKV